MFIIRALLALALTFAHSRTHTATSCHPLAFAHSLTHTLSFAHSHTHALAATHSLLHTLSHTHSHLHTLTHMHLLPPTHICTLSHTRTTAKINCNPTERKFDGIKKLKGSASGRWLGPIQQSLNFKIKFVLPFFTSYFGFDEFDRALDTAFEIEDGDSEECLRYV